MLIKKVLATVQVLFYSGGIMILMSVIIVFPLNWGRDVVFKSETHHYNHELQH
jgi:NADH:ubiquinone oxidoreductase subunit 6 (subunit J)